jgi:hypothetical protein
MTPAPRRIRPRIFPRLTLGALLLAGCVERDPVKPADFADPLVPAFDFSIQSHQAVPSITSNAFDGSRDAAEAIFTPRIADQPGGVMAGEAVHVGRGCPADPEFGPFDDDPYLADPAGRIALIQRGDCRFDNKIARAQLAGATGVIVYGFDDDESLVLMGGNNPVLSGGPSVVGTLITIPAVFVQFSTGMLLRDGVPPVTVLVAPPPPPTPGQLLDHVYEGVDQLVELDLLSDGLASSLKAQLDAARRHIDRGNLRGAANTLNAFISHVDSLEAEGMLTAPAAAYLRALAQAVLDVL